MSSDEETSTTIPDIDEVEEPKDPEDIIKILVATDIHLGYNEHDPIRGDDSFNTFEEILQHAVANEVDLVLLGGDLFHENKPSVTCYHRCISLLKRYCLGDRPVALEVLSDQSRNFPHLKNPVVNFHDPNLNVCVPVFSIHGNHDDPTGANQLSAMDIIADTGLINYFGKWTDLNHVEIYPIMIRKGITNLALYGLSHIKDERLSRLFRDKKVSMFRPQESEWFNIFVLHQNRAQNRGLKNHIPETVLPDFLNLVIWGHEHDCRLAPEPAGNGLTRISQPGSSVATSLAIGESITKKIGLFFVHKERFMMTEIKLNTVRPFIFKDITITKPEDGLTMKASEYGKEKVVAVVEEMIEEAQKLITEDGPTLPLIRLVVNFTDDSLVTNQIRLGQQYVERVANPNDMFSFKVKRPVNVKRGNKNIEDVDEMMGDELTDNLDELVDTYFESTNEALNLLSTRGLCEAVSRFIDKNDTDALGDIFKHQVTKTFDRIMAVGNLEITNENVDKLLDDLREERADKSNDELSEISKLLDSRNRVRTTTNVDDIEDCTDDDLTTSPLSTSTGKASTSTKGSVSGRTTRGKGSRGPRGPKKAGKGRAKAS